MEGEGLEFLTSCYVAQTLCHHGSMHSQAVEKLVSSPDPPSTLQGGGSGNETMEKSDLAFHAIPYSHRDGESANE